MLAGLNKITVRQTSLTARLLKTNGSTLLWLLNFHFGVQESGSSLMTTTQTFARRKIFWNYLEEVSDDLTQNDNPFYGRLWTVLTQTCLSTQVTGTWLISACTKLVWLNRRARGLSATLDPHLSCRECLGLFLCRMSELCQLFFQLDKWLLWNYLQSLWPAFTWICIFRKSRRVHYALLFKI